MLCLMQPRIPATYFAGRANGHVIDRLEVKLPFKIYEEEDGKGDDSGTRHREDFQGKRFKAIRN